jgi:Protein of unknown function (DUF2924)
MENDMVLNVAKEVAALERMTVKELRARYAETFGEQTHTHNKSWLVKRVAWRLQAVAEGDLSQRARQRAAELANDADLRLSPPKLAAAAPSPERTMTMSVRVDDGRLPIPGTVITRQYKGRSLQVKVLPQGFEYEGEVFKSLSAVAKTITGQHCNGYHFFRLGQEAGR